MRRKMFITAAFNEKLCASGTNLFSKRNAEEAIRAYEAGAAVVYVYTGTPQTEAAEQRIELMRKTLELIRSRCDAICCITTGVNQLSSLEEQFAPVAAIKPELATLDVGLMNFGLSEIIEMSWEESRWKTTPFVSAREAGFAKRFNRLEKCLRTMNENGTRPEFVVYDVATISNIAYLIKEGIIKTPVYIQFVLGIVGGIPASVNNLTFLYDTACRVLGSKNFFWSIGGMGEKQIRMASAGLALGSNVRVTLGNGDKPRGFIQSGREQVAVVRDMAMSMGYEIATSADVRKIMSLKGADKLVL